MIDIRLQALQNAEILCVRDIMALFQIDRDTVYNWKRSGKLEMKKIGGRWYADKKSVEMLLK